MSLQLVAYGVSGSLHLMNFLAFWYSNKNKYSKVIVFIDCYWGYNIISEKYLEFCKKNNMDVYINESNKQQIIFYDEDIHSDLVFVNHVSSKVLLKYKKKIHNVILIDEGLSAYTGFNNWKKAMKREKNKDVSFLLYLLRKTQRNFAEKILYRDYVIDFRAFSIKNGKMQEKYREAIHNLFSFMYANHIKKEQENNVIVFCSQPLVDLNMMTESDFSAYLLNIQDKVNQKGFSLVIKKHPVEKKFDYEKYGLTILDYDGIFEEYAFLYPMKGMISTSSTSSLLVPALYGIDSFIMDYTMVDELGKTAKRIFSNYTKPLEQL